MEYVEVFDFDGTIYNGDATLDFYFFCLMRHPRLMKYVPRQTLSGIKYYLKKEDIVYFKSQFLCFLKEINLIEETEIFWISYYRKIKHWYNIREKNRDIIISASPRFLLEPICKDLKVKGLIASEVNEKTGELIGLNCKGEEKVRRFKERFGYMPIKTFYSDSLSDTPMARLAQQSYLVRKEEIRPWK